MSSLTCTVRNRGRRFLAIAMAASAMLMSAAAPAMAQQRVLGVDISYWNTGNNQSYGNQETKGITQDMWDLGFSVRGGNRKFVWIRATRGGTTGLGQTSGTPGGGSQETLSRRYDDPRFLQNIKRATNAGMFAGAYHFARPSIAGNTGADEADHFMELAGAYMRPGFLMPVFDLEDGDGGDGLAQFSIDFSNRIYEKLGVRPGMYINGNHTNHLLASSTNAQDDIIAQPVSSGPSMVGPAYPMLWNARYANQNNPNSIPVQTGTPKNTPTTLSSFYGPWDDYGDSQPWSFWQYASTNSIPGFNQVDSGIDGNVSHGDIEYVKNYLVPAVWWGDNSGDWSTLTNWNSGQTLSTYPGDAPITPRIGPGQAAQFETDPMLPVPRLPGAAGSGPTSGQYDTVILERPGADITVAISTGTHNIRKLYMRETLNITGGSLTINYDPTYRPDNNANVRHGGPMSAQFSGAVSLSGSANLSIHTLQVDVAQTFTLGGGTLTFNTINLVPHDATPAKIAMTGDVNFSPLSNATASIATSAGPGSGGVVDLGGENRTFHVANGAANVDLSIEVPITNGALTKNGAGTLALGGANSYTGDTTVEAGKLSVASPYLADDADVLVVTGATLDLNFAATDVIDSLYIDGVSQAIGVWGAVGSGAPFTSSLITGTGLLQVTTFIPPLLLGDYNENGIVDAADYVVWRDNMGGEMSLPNDDSPGVGPDDYHRWRANFGQTNSTGSGVSSGGAVPEPTSGALIAIAWWTLAVACCRRTRRR